MTHLFVYLAVGLGVAAVAYWLLVTTEGTYLGPRIVALLYDWTARAYNGIKKLSFVDEAQHIGLPLAERLQAIDGQRVLDLACGTGRVALSLRLSGSFEGLIVGLDRSAGMLAVARRETQRADVALALLAGDGQRLPLANASVDAVTCLEALEFFTQPAQVLAECYRVLRPGGIMLTSNRVGPDARWLPFRHAGRGKQEALLRQLGFQEVDTERWQVHYDLIWARKPAQDGDRGNDCREA